MKVVILHPPLYPVNDKFFNLLGNYVDLTVYSFGDKPGLHDWNIENKNNNYNLKILDGFTDLKKYAVSYKTQFKIDWIKDILRDKPDVIISVAFWIPSVYASLLKVFLGYKFVILTDAIQETEKNISNTRKMIRKIVCVNTDATIAASNLTEEYLTMLCPKIPTIHSMQTIDVNSWVSEIDTLATKEELRKELNIPLNKNILLGVGGFTDKKNWISILNQIDKLDDCIFILIGFGELEKQYHNFVKSSNLTDKVKILTKKEGIELKKYFKASDIFIFPSLYDQFGYVALEALASALPVICSKNTGASSLIEDNFNGFIVNPTDDFIDEIKLTIKNLPKMSENSLKTMKEKTLENKAKEFSKILENIVGTK